MKRRMQALLLLVCLLLSFCAPALALTDVQQAAMEDTAQYLLSTVKSPQMGSAGGEWTVLGLARSGLPVPDDYFDGYVRGIEDLLVRENGVLHEQKYTEYARVVLALSAIGRDPRDIAGYNLLLPLADFEKVCWQGINGPIFALLALDCKDYEIPANPDAAVQATREMYLDEILKRQLLDGGFSLSGESADPDVTAMALQALAKYQDRAEVQEATARALSCLSAMQEKNGGYESYQTVNTESTVQVIVALCELGIDLSDSRFVKSDGGLMDHLLSHYRTGQGFMHSSSNGGSDLMATEQGLYALVAVNRAQQGENTLYRMGDVAFENGDPGEEDSFGLPGKDAAIVKMPVVSPGKTFADIADSPAKEAIEALASRTIINGKSETAFEPSSTMTRAEFATIVVRGLGLTPQAAETFSDVSAQDWFAGYVGTASRYGIIYGKSETQFAPNDSLSRQEAAVMVARAAKLCGMDTTVPENGQRDILSQFPDYTACAGWATESLAFCYQEGILSQEEMDLRPDDAALRSEIAQMLYNMLRSARLL